MVALSDRARRVGPVAGGRGPAGGSVTRSPDAPLFERRTGLGEPTALARRAAPPGVTHPFTLEAHGRVSHVMSASGVIGRAASTDPVGLEGGDK